MEWQSTSVLRIAPAQYFGPWVPPPQVSPTAPLSGWHTGEVCLKNRLRRQWQITRDPVLKAEVNRLHSLANNRLKEWRKEQWGATLESLNP
jgi:hypothetical protein